VDQPAQSRSEIADQLRPVEVAYLGGGAKAAVMAAVAGLHARKAVAVLRNRRLVATGIDPTTRAMAVEYAVLRAVREPTTLGSLRSAAGVLRGVAQDRQSAEDARTVVLGAAPLVVLAGPPHRRRRKCNGRAPANVRGSRPRETPGVAATRTTPRSDERRALRSWSDAADVLR
jgi:hypothetical protein